MIDLYYAPTPNGWKITIMLEECKLPYKIIPMNLGKGDQFEPHFLEISPNNRMPAIIDYQGLKGEKVSVFESGAILIYLAEKSGKFLSKEPLQRIKVLEWLFWQVGGLGPMAGQVSHFINYAPNFPGDHSYSENRYKNEYDRLLGVMNNILDQKEYLAGEYSKVAHELRNTFSLAYYSNKQGRKLGMRKIRVRVKNPDFRVRTKTSYFVGAAKLSGS